MPSFKVEHTTKLTSDEAYGKVKQYLQESQSIRKLDSNLECSFDDQSKTGRVKGGKFECEMKIEQNGTTKVVLDINLSFLLSPFKGTIQKTLQEKMTKILG